MLRNNLKNILKIKMVQSFKKIFHNIIKQSNKFSYAVCKNMANIKKYGKKLYAAFDDFEEQLVNAYELNDQQEETLNQCMDQYLSAIDITSAFIAKNVCIKSSKSSKSAHSKCIDPTGQGSDQISIKYMFHIQTLVKCLENICPHLKNDQHLKNTLVNFLRYQPVIMTKLKYNDCDAKSISPEKSKIFDMIDVLSDKFDKYSSQHYKYDEEKYIGSILFAIMLIIIGLILMINYPNEQNYYNLGMFLIFLGIIIFGWGAYNSTKEYQGYNADSDDDDDTDSDDDSD
jgi:hypothetical protein